jgi:hypothetical protein
MPLDEKFRMNLANRRDKVISAGGPDKIDERHQKGLMTARERLAALFQADTFQEYGAHIRHGATAFGMGDLEVPSDGWWWNRLCHGPSGRRLQQDFMVMGARQNARQDRLGAGLCLETAHLINFRLRRGAHPGGRGLARRLRRGVLPQRAAFRCGAADRDHRGSLRRRRVLLAGVDGLDHHDAAQRAHVHHRPAGDKGE